MRGRFGWAALVVWLALAGQAWGCSCMMRGGCGVLRRGDAMFVGKALTVTMVDRQEDRFVHQVRLFRFEVVESFDPQVRVGEVVTVETGMGGGDCGYGFQLGERYLVDGYRPPPEAGLSPDRMTTGICGETAPVAQAVSLLRQLRLAAAGQRVPDASGLVATREGKPVAGVPVRLTDEQGKVLRATTDAEGIYTVGVVPEGKWTLGVELPANLTTYSLDLKWFWELDVPADAGARACRKDVTALPGGRISGVVDVGGARRLTAFVAAIPLSLPAGVTLENSGGQVGEDGKFEVKYLPAGDYLLEFTTGFGYSERWFYPGVRDRSAAQTVHVDDGKATEGVRSRRSSGPKSREY